MPLSSFSFNDQYLRCEELETTVVFAVYILYHFAMQLCTPQNSLHVQPAKRMRNYTHQQGIPHCSVHSFPRIPATCEYGDPQFWDPVPKSVWGLLHQQVLIQPKRERKRHSSRLLTCTTKPTVFQ